MNNNQESNYFIPILSAIAGVGAIITVLSPSVFSNEFFSVLFIDNSVIQFSSTLAIIITVVTIWFASSMQSYQLFNAGKKSIYKLTLFFIGISIIFYSSKLVSGNGNLIKEELGSIIQLASYLLAYFNLSLIIGLLLRDSFADYKRNRMEIEKFDRLREALYKSGFIKSDLTIMQIKEHPMDNNVVFFGTHDVIFRVKNQNYYSIFSRDFSQVLHSEKIQNSK